MKRLFNRVTVSGTHGNITKFVESLHVLPVKFTDTDESAYPEEYFNQCGYFMHGAFNLPPKLLEKNSNNYREWCIVNWGTADTIEQAREVFDEYLNREKDEDLDGVLEFEFVTVNSFCTKWLTKVSESFPELEFALFLQDDINLHYSVSLIECGAKSVIMKFDNYSEYLYNYVHEGVNTVTEIVDEVVDYYIEAFIDEEGILDTFNLEIFLFDDFMWASGIVNSIGVVIRESIIKSIDKKGLKIPEGTKIDA